MSLMERFESNIFYGLDGCWHWIGPMTDTGYGKICRFGKNYKAHRVSYEFFKGGIGKMYVCHTCDNRYCVNPDHLFLGTHQDNMTDMKEKGRRKNKGRGDKNGMSKLSTENVLEIRASDERYEILARKYGVKACTISQIKTRRVWKHI